MKHLKLILLGLIISSLFGYMEWGESNSAFIFQAEYELFFSSNASAASFTHPVILIPLIGQLILLICLFVKQPNLKLILFGSILIGLLILLILLVGVLAFNIKTIVSTLPFLGFMIIYIINYRKENRQIAT